jgi:Tfp pilus assembly protein PilF
MTESRATLESGVKHHRAGRLADAEACYQQVLRAEPRQPDASHLLGLIACQFGKFEVAVELIGRAAFEAPERAPYHASLGSALLALGRLDAAEAALRRAVDIDPANPIACDDLGSVLARQGKVDEAVEVFRTAIALNPSWSKPYVGMVNTLVAAGRQYQAVEQQMRSVEPSRLRQKSGPAAEPDGTPSAAPVEDSFPTVNGLMTELSVRLGKNDTESSLALLQDFVRSCILDRRAHARVFADRRLDERCQRIGAAVLSRMQPSAAAANDRVDCVILATELYRVGGHTAVIDDLLRSERLGERIVVLLTDAFGTGDADVAGERLGSAVCVHVAPRSDLSGKLRWTLDRLCALRPRRLILMNHHHDAIAIAAAQPCLAEQTVFYHHADTQLCLGVTLAHAMHVDPHPMGLDNCRNSVGVPSPVYWPLVARDQGCDHVRPLKIDGKLRTCSTGTANKFDFPYKYAYSDLLPRILQVTRGVHVHIGPLPQATTDRIRRRLDELGVPPQHFVQIPSVPSLWQALQGFCVDLLLASFPLAGGKALIEAMGAGIPVVGHDCYISPFFGAAALYYPGAYQWSEADALLAHLGALTEEALTIESRAARRHYEEFHSPQVLARAIDGGQSAPIAPPSRKNAVDPLQSYLDDVYLAADDQIKRAQNQRRVDSPG